MSDVLRIVFSLSLSGTLLILVLFLCKPVYKNRISKRWQYYIWLVVVARLLLPFAPRENLMEALFDRAGQSAGNTIEQLSRSTDQAEGENIDANSGQTSEIGMASEGSEAALAEQTDRSAGQGEKEDGPADFYVTGGDANDLNTGHAISGTDSGVDSGADGGTSGFTEKILQYLWLIWLGGAALLLIRKVTMYQSFVKYIRAGREEVSDIKLLDLLAETEEQMEIKRPLELYTNKLVSSPLLIGLFRPCIILPGTDLPEEDLRYTIRHELIHYRHFDLLYKWLVQITVCLHWFNPFVWLMGKETGRACELACDETVAQELDEEGRRAYGDTLLRAIKNGGMDCFREPVVSVTLSESGELLKERLGAIADFRKVSKPVRALSFVMAAVLLLGGVMTGAAAPVSENLSKKGGGNAMPEGVPGKDVGDAMSEGVPGKDVGDAMSGKDIIEDASMETLELKGTTYYLVFNESQLRAIGTGKYGLDKDYMQQADIQMSADEWEPVGTMEEPFTGSYNGNGYEIIGLTAAEPDAEPAGMFGAARDAHIYNITLRDYNIERNKNSAEQPDFPILACDLGGSRVYDNTVYLPDEIITGVQGTDRARTADEIITGVQGTDSTQTAAAGPAAQEIASRAGEYYENGNLPEFGRAFSVLDESSQKFWLETIYADEKIAFFSVSLQQIETGSPLIGYYAQKAYEDGRIAFFSVLTDYMSKDMLESWQDQAAEEGKFNFESVLLTALGRDWELEARQEEKDRQREEEYRNVGITMNGKLRYYQGQLVNIFLDMSQPGKSFYILDMNPDGVVNVKIIRDENGKIQGAAYMTDAEVKELFGDI